MRALRPLLFGMTLAVMLETFALPPVVMTGGRAYAAENSPSQPPLPAANNAGSTSQDAAAPSPQGQDAAAPSPDDTPLASKPGSLPLASPVKSSAQCPVGPLPPHAQKLCAEAAAQLEALHAAAAQLPNRRDIRMGVTEASERTALAAELYTALVEGSPAMADANGGPAAQGITVTLLARPDAAETLLRLLRNPDVLLARRLLLTDLANALASARQVADELAAADAMADGQVRANMEPGSGGTWYVAKATPPGQIKQNPPMPVMPDARQEAARRAALRKADVLAAELTACLAAMDALRLEPEGWLTGAAALPLLEKSAADLPGSAALRLLLAESQLQSGMPQRSIASAAAALDLSPGLTRARYIRALAHWRLQQLALAEDDLSAALDATPEAFLHTADRVRLLRARGALRMLRNNTQGTCADLTAACALGDCDGLAAAREQQLCLTPSVHDAVAPATQPAAADQSQPPHKEATP